MNKTLKRIVGGAVASACVLCLLVLIYALLISFTTSTDDFSYYTAICGESDGTTQMPLLGPSPKQTCPFDLPGQNELDACTAYRFDYTAKKEFFFVSHAYTLVCSFSHDAYLAETVQLQQQYPRLSAGLPGDDYPHRMLFVGCSDRTREIAYIYFYDPELDHVAPSTGDFILAHTGWRNVADGTEEA